ncbi:4-hydroxythreonine-4-phosphate dehydrogenase PdxA [Subsaximicrobium wynnwilliamsii]|uniref:4-hydroxythreonine-4-phosphate dehydrogenase PdxA n=1 Tax=Subsaximicrobium wynnwilliamsii TaxID=291179 RepID=A0A5C6ZEI5_9FLAO|nr:4-hydroxythreonine-4-phosphate dehydrogenase PdxA [Subsaximicrobium wynnwilliamsii]TXD82704.1 4-hydroxythreonine-4-phosphate dehydrogenase PdxA [Subsaximicrobium wynnwilliamsii]TXD88439.1 4-hydroxythreonine-4-phosphate dehydrogenase PdxA [Subsaximicrobium wynnwilliamsii]TXE02366.1 4-hydroxythreonine-4-phosphate dehydrogenase PdxA [Subsaximicrobium wynnwilliamsii]
MEKDKNIRVGISIGDLNGIGSEIILKTFEDSRMLEFCTPVIFASIKTMSFFKKHFNSSINFHGINHLNQIVDGKINVLNVWKENVSINFGEEDVEIGAYSVKSLETATAALISEDIDVLVTAPIHKHNIQSESFKFPGHTNYLAEKLGGKSLMFMVTETLKVGLLTDHVPLKDASAQITAALISEKIDTVYTSLIEDFAIERPKIAILGINPHAGDNGVIGTEDDSILKPELEKLRNKGKLVYGPYAADSFFGSKNYKNFDAIIAAYHDQGLIPFKTISFGHGVNFTAGLNKIRTSPDHGTAFEIAGKGEADHGSFKAAVFMAMDIFKTRTNYKIYSKNPLKKRQKKI